MKIIKLLYLKYSLSFTVCLVSSCIIFFIFSLLGNLNEDYVFYTIIKLSLLNAIQILMYVPSFVFLISVILLAIFLRSKNEIIIIKSYMNINRMMIFFLPLIIIFTILEVSKKDLVVFLEDNKNSLINKNNKYMSKILIDEKSDTKIITVFKKIDLKNSENAEYRSYKIFNNKIQIAQFSSNLFMHNNNLIAKNYTEYKDNLIKNYNNNININVDYTNLIKQSSIVKNISEKNSIYINLKLINFTTFFILFFSYVFLSFNNKKYVNTKESLTNPVFNCLFFLLYSFFIFNNSLSVYKQEFEILASLIIGMLVFKESVNE